MAYLNINISYSEDTLCEEISFTESGEHSYVLGSIITLSDARLWRNRQMIIISVSHEESHEEGVITAVSGYSIEYKYTRKSPDCDISFFTMTATEKSQFEAKNPLLDFQPYYKYGDEYGVGGWSMHSIVSKIVIEWMGLNLVNNLPDYWINDFTISIGSTFFESLNSLISEFAPIVVLSGGTLYILERSGAGALNAGAITPSGFTNRSVDREYVPVPGCIKVEGQEGEYLTSKDPVATRLYFSKNNKVYLTSSGTHTSPEGMTETYRIEEVYYADQQGKPWALYSKNTSVTMIIDTARTSEAPIGYEEATIIDYYEETLDFKYERPVPKRESVMSYSWFFVSTIFFPGWKKLKYKHSTSAKEYIYDADWMLLEQIETKFCVFDGEGWAGRYEKFDGRNYNDIGFDSGDLDNLVLLPFEVKTTKYAMVTDEAYSVDMTTVEYCYVLWPPDILNPDGIAITNTNYTFDHELVASGGGQQNKPTPRTLTVWAGNCPFQPDLSVMTEPPAIFSIATPSWDSVENCYAYLSALALYAFQRVSAAVPIIDPLPLMAINGLGGIIESGITGKNYIRGYNINIDPTNGYSTELELEARRA